MARPTKVPTERDDVTEAGALEAAKEVAAPEATQEVEPAAAEADDGAEAPAPTGLRRRVGGALANPRLAWGVAAVAVLLAVVFAAMWAPLYAEARDRDEARLAATEIALRLTTFEGENIEAWLAEMEDLATGDYADEIATIFDAELRDALREAGAESVGELIDDGLFVQSIDDDEARAFAVVRQTIANDELAEPVQDELRMHIDLQRVDGDWLASGVSVLGPGTMALPDAPPELDLPDLPDLPDEDGGG